MSIMIKWETINDDSLLTDENAINFLITEFQKKSLNIIWFKKNTISFFHSVSGTKEISAN